MAGCVRHVSQGQCCVQAVSLRAIRLSDISVPTSALTVMVADQSSTWGRTRCTHHDGWPADLFTGTQVCVRAEMRKTSTSSRWYYYQRPQLGLAFGTMVHIPRRQNSLSHGIQKVCPVIMLTRDQHGMSLDQTCLGLSQASATVDWSHCQS